MRLRQCFHSRPSWGWEPESEYVLWAWARSCYRSCDCDGSRACRVALVVLRVLHTEQKNLYEDLQMRLSENIDRPPPLSVKEQREAARRGALYGQNPTNLFRKPKLKRPKSAPFG